MTQKKSKPIITIVKHLFWSLGHLNFEFVSNFVLRISKLDNPSNCYSKPPVLI